MRVALFGGSFNPPHLAHQMVALYVLETAARRRALVDARASSIRSTSRSRRSRTGCACASSPPRRWARARASRRSSASSAARAARSARCARCKLHPEHRVRARHRQRPRDEVPTWYGADELQAPCRSSSSGAPGSPGSGRARPSRCPRSARRRSGARSARESRSTGSCRAPFSTTSTRTGCSEPGSPAMSDAPTDARPASSSSWAPASSARRWRRAWSRAGIPVTGCTGVRSSSRTRRAALRASGSTGEIPPALSESDVVIIAVRDERIPEVAERLVSEKRLRREQVVLHTSGANAAAQVLAHRAPARARASARCTRWSRSPTRASPSSSCTSSRSASRATSRRAPSRAASCARWARGAVPRRREPAALSRGRRPGVELRRRARRHGAARCS